jgi:outer membrane protein X
MKKLVVLFSMMFFVMSSALAQKGIQAGGVHLTYGTEIESFGIGVKYQYNITDNIRLEPSMNYFFKNKNDVDQFDLNANVHYLFPIASNVRIYPLAGLSFARWSNVTKYEELDFETTRSGVNVKYESLDDDATRLGVNVGGGAECDITNNLMLNFELKYQFVSDFDQAVFNIGVAYMF